jgi:hypothetical protein
MLLKKEPEPLAKTAGEIKKALTTRYVLTV